MITGIRQPKSLRTKSKPDEVLAYSSQSIDQYVTSNRVFSQSGVTLLLTGLVDRLHWNGFTLNLVCL